MKISLEIRVTGGRLEGGKKIEDPARKTRWCGPVGIDA